jgi:hypothetical protein
VSGKAVAAKKKRPLIYRRRRDRIDASRRAQLDRGFDISGSGLPSRARFNARLDMSINIVEMKNHRAADSIGKRLAPAYDLVSTLQVEGARVMRQQLRIANNYWRATAKHFFLRDGFEHNLWPDPGRIAHGYSNARQ